LIIKVNVELFEELRIIAKELFITSKNIFEEWKNIASYITSSISKKKNCANA
jgi:hypothetical protein